MMLSKMASIGSANKAHVILIERELFGAIASATPGLTISAPSNVNGPANAFCYPAGIIAEVRFCSWRATNLRRRLVKRNPPPVMVNSNENASRGTRPSMFRSAANTTDKRSDVARIGWILAVLRTPSPFQSLGATA